MRVNLNFIRHYCFDDRKLNHYLILLLKSCAVDLPKKKFTEIQRESMDGICVVYFLSVPAWSCYVVMKFSQKDLIYCVALWWSLLVITAVDMWRTVLIMTVAMWRTVLMIMTAAMWHTFFNNNDTVAMSRTVLIIMTVAMWRTLLIRTQFTLQLLPTPSEYMYDVTFPYFILRISLTPQNDHV